jgi:hypothetical protein
MAALFAFLQGTVDRQSTLYRLGGQCDILRKIWCLACEEWWELHIDRFPREIPVLFDHPYWPCKGEAADTYPFERREAGGCPAAVIAVDLEFPPPAVVPMGTFENQETGDLYVNMMPFLLSDLETLPPYCRQYDEIIRLCRNDKPSSNAWENYAYLTIDERPTVEGTPQRRGGLHVESPGYLPVDPGQNAKEARFCPGAEHNWGRGVMIRNQKIVGGIFMASNTASSCAIWDCKIIDGDGSIIGPHGNIERMRDLLGPADKVLKAGELVWITDKTPHESLPFPGGGARRQFIRVVTGCITAWFADHCTPNPLGIVPPSSVRVVHGNKFDIYRGLTAPWLTGSAESIKLVNEEQELRELLYFYDLGHLANALIAGGFNSTKKMAKLKNSNWRGDHAWFVKISNLFEPDDKYGKFYFEILQLRELVDMLPQ